MKLGMFAFDVLSLLIIAALWGGSSFVVWSLSPWILATLWSPLAIVSMVLLWILTLIMLVGILHRLLPRVRPGRYELMRSPMFYFWIVRFILYRALFAPGLKGLIFQFNTLRFLALRALGARVSFGASMSSDVTLLDPWLMVIESGVTIGAGCMISGHTIDRGKLLLGEVRVGEGSLLAARVMVAPGVSVGKRARVLVGVIIGHEAKVGDGAVIGATTSLEVGSSVEAGVRLATGTFVHKGAVASHDTAPLEVIELMPASSST